MPRRWLSRKVRHPPTEHDNGPQHQHQPRNNAAQPRTLDEFDLAPARTVVTDQEKRPKTSGGVASRRKNKVQPGQQNKRPRTSDAQLDVPTGATASNWDDEMIGIAFGSPTHPPTTFYGNLNDLIPAPLEKPELKSTCGGRNDPTRQRSDHWKKLGSLFKSRSSSFGAKAEPREPFYKLKIQNGVTVPFASRSTSALSSHGHRYSRSTPASQESANSSIELQVDAPTAIVVYPTRTSSRAASNRAPLPKLEVSIPNVHMDRYSVMFGHLRTMSNPPSSLLTRRDRNLDKLNVVDVILEEDYASMARRESGTLTPGVPSRRTTSPSLAKPTAGFSLFPNKSPGPNELIKRGLKSPRTYLQRANTSPARISPVRDHFDAEKPEPLRFRRMASENGLASPEDLTTASTEQDMPWSGGGAVYQTPISAATTMDHEIIFDITLFDHSRVASAIQTEAPKLAPNLDAISDRLRAEHFSVQSTVSMMSTGETIYEGRIGKDQFAAIDDAIAAMEDIASPVLPADSFPITQPQVQHTVKTGAEVELKAEPTPVTVPDSSPENNTNAGSRSQLDQLSAPGGALHPIVRMRSKANIGLMSPVVEVAEERSPSVCHVSPRPTESRKTPSPLTLAVPVQSTSLAAPASPLKTFLLSAEDDPPEGDAPEHEQPENDRPKRGLAANDDAKQDSPPPVPEKDTKYIPLSRFALKNTASVVTKRTGIHVHQSRPSITELTPIEIPPSVPSPRRRSTTRPNRNAHAPSLSKSRSTATTANRNPSKASPLNHTPSSHPSRRRQHKPQHAASTRVAEVAVARTVSLKRKGNGANPTTVVVTPRREETIVPNIIVCADTKPDLQRGESYKAEEGENFVEQQRCQSPMIVAAKRGHRPGISVGGVIEEVA